MAEQDVYTKALSTILNDLENVYGLKTVDKTGTRKLCDLDVEECLLQLQDSITQKQHDQKKIVKLSKALYILVTFHIV